MARDRRDRGSREQPPAAPATATHVGARLRAWRERAGVSQHRLALEAAVSARHLSFVETGRAHPGAELIARVAERLAVSAAERNDALVAAGYAPVPSSRSQVDAALDAVRPVIDATLARHRPFPAYLVDRYWRVVASNGALPVLYEGVAAELLRAPVNVVRLMLHPHGLAPRVSDLPRWRRYYLAQLRRQLGQTRDPHLESLMREVLAYEPDRTADADGGGDETPPAPALPLTIATRVGDLSFLTATAILGVPAAVTTEEFALELMVPADGRTEAAVIALGDDA